MNDFSAFKIFAAIALVTVSCTLFSTLPACGHRGATEAMGNHSAGILLTTGLAQSLRLAREAQVTCGDDQHCPENVGMVVTATETGVDRCTGSLIAPDLVLTSSHCVPAESRSENGCGGRIRFLMPALNEGARPALDARCAQVLAGDANAAYAFLRLDSRLAGRRPLELESAGLADGAAFTIAAVSPTSDARVYGEVRVQSVHAYQKTAIYPQFSQDLSPVAALGGYAVGIAAFGAPVLDAQGSVRAVVQAGLSPQALHELQQAYESLLKGAQVADFAFAANVSCIGVPGSSARALPRVCASAPAVSADSGASTPSIGGPAAALTRAITPQIIAAAQAELVRRIATWQGEVGQKFRWGFSHLPPSPSQVAQPSPICMQKSEQWLGNYHHWYTRGGYVQDAQIDLMVPRFQLQFSLTEVLQPRLDIQTLPSARVSVHFNPRTLAQSGQSSVNQRSSTDGSAVGEATTLPRCSN